VASEWIAGVVGGFLGAAGAVGSQIVSGKNQLKAQAIQLDNQLDAAREGWERERVAVGEQWAEENRIRLRDERRILYARYTTEVRNLSPDLTLAIRADGAKLGSALDKTLATILEISQISDEIELAAGDDVRQYVQELRATLTEIQGQARRARAPDVYISAPDTPQMTGYEWFRVIRTHLSGFIEAARAEVI
jgi:hypothetical protein